MKIRHVKSLFHIISLEKSHFLFCSLSKIRLRAIILRSHLDGSKALRNYCCECNDLLAKQNPKKSAQEASFGSFSTIFLYLFGGFVKESVGFRIRSKDTRRTCISQDLTARAVRTKRANLKLRMSRVR